MRLVAPCTRFNRSLRFVTLCEQCHKACEASSLGSGGNGSMLEMSLARGNWVI